MIIIDGITAVKVCGLTIVVNALIPKGRLIFMPNMGLLPIAAKTDKYIAVVNNISEAEWCVAHPEFVEQRIKEMDSENPPKLQ